MKKFLGFSLPLIWILGCAGIHSPSSGNAEITVAKAPVEQILEVLNHQMSLKEYQVKFTSSEKAVYVKPSGSFTFKTLYSASPSLNTEAILEVTCRFSQSPQGLRVISSSRIVENPGSVNERSASEDQWETVEQLRVVLREVKRILDSRK